jgi:GAG-pre-integrase domain
MVETPELELFLLHCRLDHIPFRMLGKLYPKLYSRYNKAKLVCDACEFAKHTRTTYPSFGNRSSSFSILFIRMCGGPQGLLLYLVRGDSSLLLIVIAG